MRTVAILPVKTLRPRQAAADRRLPEPARAGRGDGRRRADALAQVPALDEVIVVTAQPVAAAAWRRPSSTTRRGGPVGGGAAGIEAALERGAERVLLVPGDCPALDPLEVSALLGTPRAS